MIKISDIGKSYHMDELDIVALKKMSLEVNEGEFVAIMGPSGCGKTTLLNILGFLDDPDSGSYVFEGMEVTHANERKRADLRKRNVGFLFQNFNLIDDLTIFENVELPMIYTGLPTSVRAKRTEEILDRMHIDERRKTYPQQLSGGQQQRVALARAVVNKPKLILADEPTANLDHDNGRQVMELLDELNKDGVTIIMVTHSENDARYSHRVIRLPDIPIPVKKITGK
ncbi:ABC transporter ATP-binding protein [Mucilaginibacter aquariorum]|uniref:ABC transporter ATP-binding protein n=1 Tax=Mucilaginibacter aquariorum TaxID=2967225 RepID=A0ABT1T4Q2_9SPHI|nr:ABC transporter ATP-binding protein [Mucilaginibacter aquariorum]MCQ6959554.1 ABC transporter ATP-binding protein [Mucilaginibacter aquariorum]